MMEKCIILYNNVRFTVITENLIRCEISPRKSFCDFNTAFAVNRKYNGCEYKVQEAEDFITVSTANMSITYKMDDSANLVVEDGWIKTNFKRNETDIYILAYGNDYKKALHTLFYVSGKPALPRKYVFGSWYSRWWPYTDEEIKDIVDEYDEHDFPLDIMVIDMDWHHHDWMYRDNEECRKRTLSSRMYMSLLRRRALISGGWTGSRMR